MVELYQENSQLQSHIVNISIDGNTAAGSVSTNGVVETPTGDVDVGGFAPFIQKFRSTTYPNDYRSDVEMVFCGPKVKKSKLESLGIDPVESVLAYSDIEVWWNIDVEDSYAVGFIKIDDTTNWTTGEQVVQHMSRDGVAGRTNVFVGLTIPQPQNDEIFILAYSDSPDVIPNGAGLSNITATVSCQAFVPNTNQTNTNVNVSVSGSGD